MTTPTSQHKHPLYQTLLQIMQAEKAAPMPKWYPAAVTPADLQVIRKESAGGQFDKLNLRQNPQKPLRHLQSL
jgi:hypothetical protein